MTFSIAGFATKKTPKIGGFFKKDSFQVALTTISGVFANPRVCKV
jgi:hypothetical protein